MTQLSVSIITPSFNQGKFIQRTIASVLSQNIPNLDYIICDGGSTDETLNIINQYAEKFHWLSEPDKGQTDAINKGINKTQGDIIGWLNSDDIFYPNSIQTVLDFFTAHPEIDVVYGEANYIDKEDNILSLYPTEPWNVERLKIICYLSQPSVFFRRSSVEKAGPLNTNLNYCMDYEYWIRLMKNGAQFAHIPQVLSATRIYPETKTHGAKVPFILEINSMLKQRIGNVPSEWLLLYAHIILEEQGYTSRKNPIRYGVYIPLLALYGGLKWNHKIRLSDIKILFNWFKKSIKKRFLNND